MPYRHVAAAVIVAWLAFVGDVAWFAFVGGPPFALPQSAGRRTKRSEIAAETLERVSPANAPASGKTRKSAEDAVETSGGHAVTRRAVTAAAENLAPRGRDWLKTSEVAAELGVDPRTVRNWIQAGLIRADSTPGSYYIHRSDLDAFLAKPRTPRARRARQR